MMTFLSSAIIVAVLTTISVYVILYRIIPTSMFRQFLKWKSGRAILDTACLAITTTFMFYFAGASMFSMTVGAIAAFIASALIQIHSWIVVENIETPQEAWCRASAAVRRAYEQAKQQDPIEQDGSNQTNQQTDSRKQGEARTTLTPEDLASLNDLEFGT